MKAKVSWLSEEIIFLRLLTSFLQAVLMDKIQMEMPMKEPRFGYYGRVQYNYKEKYLAEFIWRYDGSYMFPEDGTIWIFPWSIVRMEHNK